MIGLRQCVHERLARWSSFLLRNAYARDAVNAIRADPARQSDLATVEALTRRDVGQLFRLVQRAGKLTQTRVGMAVGLSQAQISEIMAGSRKVSSVEVLSRIVSGLNIPEPARSVLFLGDTAQSAGTPTAPVIPADDDTGSDDVVAVYATRGLISRTRWNETISGCCEHPGSLRRWHGTNRWWVCADRP